jgi:glyoxylase-like metal-dependent hydrolase (beta-lactamase superfamily II)
MSGRRSDEAAIIAQKLGFEDVYSLQGGLKGWKGPIQPFMNNHSPWVHTIFDTETETAQYIVTDLGNTKYLKNVRYFNLVNIDIFFFIESKEAFIVDPVLNYDPFSSIVHPLLAKTLIQFIEKYQLNVSKIIDTHVHAVKYQSKQKPII